MTKRLTLNLGRRRQADLEALGREIDSDPDEMVLVQRVYEKFGYGPL